jgi:hypothetical protein
LPIVGRSSLKLLYIDGVCLSFLSICSRRSCLCMSLISLAHESLVISGCPAALIVLAYLSSWIDVIIIVLMRLKDSWIRLGFAIDTHLSHLLLRLLALALILVHMQLIVLT